MRLSRTCIDSKFCKKIVRERFIPARATQMANYLVGPTSWPGTVIPSHVRRQLANAIETYPSVFVNIKLGFQNTSASTIVYQTSIIGFLLFCSGLCYMHWCMCQVQHLILSQDPVSFPTNYLPTGPSSSSLCPKQVFCIFMTLTIFSKSSEPVIGKGNLGVAWFWPISLFLLYYILLYYIYRSNVSKLTVK